MPTKLTLENAQKVCQKLEGKYYTLDSEARVKTALEMANDNQHCKGSAILTGWSDELLEGSYNDVNDESVTLFHSNFAPTWAPTEPNGRQTENCLTVKDGKFYDIRYSWSRCGICDLKSSPVLKMRGGQFTSDYGWTGKLVGKTFSLTP